MVFKETIFLVCYAKSQFASRAFDGWSNLHFFCATISTSIWKFLDRQVHSIYIEIVPLLVIISWLVSSLPSTTKSSILTILFHVFMATLQDETVYKSNGNWESYRIFLELNMSQEQSQTMTSLCSHKKKREYLRRTYTPSRKDMYNMIVGAL